VNFLLLLHPSSEKALKIDWRALSVTQKRQKALESQYRGYRLINANGEAREVMGFTVGHVIGLPRWLAWLSLTGERNLAVHLGPLRTIALNEFREKFLVFLKSAARPDEWSTAGKTLEEMADEIGRASSVSEVFEIIEKYDPGVPGLDVLV
jgi:hypothetical protein